MGRSRRQRGSSSRRGGSDDVKGRGKPFPKDKVVEDDELNLDLDVSDEDLEYMEENPSFANTMERIGRDLHESDEEEEGGDGEEKISRRKKKRQKMVEEDREEENIERQYEEFVHERSSTQVKGRESDGLEVNEKRKKDRKKKGKPIGEETPTGTSEALETLPSLPPEKLREIRVRRVKREIAEICVSITQNPEGEFAKLDDIIAFCEDGDVLISTLAIRSLCEVFKDICPGYKIKVFSPGEEDEQEGYDFVRTSDGRKVQLSKSVRKLRRFEGELVKSYERYIKILKKNAMHGILGPTCAMCLGILLSYLPHFNFASNIAASLVPVLSDTHGNAKAKREAAKMHVMTLFRDSVYTDAAKDIVARIGKWVKYHLPGVDRAVVDVFLALPLTLPQKDPADLIKQRRDEKKSKRVKYRDMKKGGKKNGQTESEADGERDGEEKGMKGSKRKILSENDERELERDLRESRASIQQKERDMVQTSILEVVLLTYFRILQHPEVSRDLLFAAFDGLRTFGHLMNVELVADVILILQDPQKNRDPSLPPLDVFTQMHALRAASGLMHGLGEALSVDVSQIYRQLYRLMDLGREEIGDKNIAKELTLLIQEVLFHPRSVLSDQRLAAFSKKLCELSIVCPDKTLSMSLLSMVDGLLENRERLQSLWEDAPEDVASGHAYQETALDPDLAHGLSASGFELSALKMHHYAEAVRSSVCPRVWKNAKK
eukprot:TRINITY_DN2455_c0_g1_i1.p1 TRINITY_DN2455_c0_g1~~TRINITY_DN2455_c0_g1_i1.p1  ORF type:complete len:718 (-),score=253.59 TRINITY_DN2455_c0_g1_i1:2416-4569(-)